VTLLEMVQYLARRDAHPPQFVAGEPLLVRLSPEQYEPVATFRPPGADAAAQAGRAADEPGRGTASLVLAGPRAVELGTYHVELLARDGHPQTRPLCVNLAPAESDLAAASAAELAGAIPGIPHEYVRAGDDFLAGDGPARRELWPAVLILLLAALFLEQVLAWHFGLPRAAPRPGWLPQQRERTPRAPLRPARTRIRSAANAPISPQQQATP
jgi:hypothetical protein